jgi:hypothetical protein
MDAQAIDFKDKILNRILEQDGEVSYQEAVELTKYPNKDLLYEYCKKVGQPVSPPNYILIK